MSERQVNYDQIAPTYDQRYTAHTYDGVGAALSALVEKVDARRILEVGCGTGHWLTTLRPVVRSVYGLDLSLGMLRRAQQAQSDCPLICGRASHLPFAGAAFDLVFCANAFHHFAQPRSFVAEARRLLRAGGALAIIGMDPHLGRDRWCVYDYFPETRDIDLARFPSGGTILEWMATAGFDSVEWRVAERIIQPRVGREVLESPILQKHGTSQLALLTDEAYAAGMERIRAAVRQAEESGERLVFPADVSLTIVTGYVRAG